MRVARGVPPHAAIAAGVPAAGSGVRVHPRNPVPPIGPPCRPSCSPPPDVCRGRTTAGRALEIDRATPGPHHPHTATAPANLSLPAADLGDADAARGYAAEAVATAAEHLAAAAAGQDEQGRRRHAASLRWHLDLHLSLTAGSAAAFPAALRSKGAAPARRVALARVPSTPDVVATRDRLRAVGGEFTALVDAPPPDEERAA